MLIVEDGMISRFFHLWNIKEDRKASVEEINEVIRIKEVSVKYFEKEKMIGITLGDWAKDNFRLFEPNEK